MSKEEDEVINLIKERASVGLSKYGVSMDRNDLGRLDWLKHAQEEAMDLAVYLQKLINEEQQKEKPKACCCGEGGVQEWTRTSSMDEFKEEKN